MSRSFNLTIITPERTIFEGQAISLVVPSVLGYLGILANHSPLLAKLKEGRIIIKKEADQPALVLKNRGSGFLQVRDNQVNLLLDEKIQQQDIQG